MENNQNDPIINVTVEEGMVTLNMKNGDRIPAKAKTTYTHYKSGRKDCNVEIEKPLSLGGEQVQPGK